MAEHIIPSADSICENREIYNNQECNEKLDQLENKIDVDFPFVKNENGSYSILRDQITLPLELTGEQLVQANKITLQLITYYSQNDSAYYNELFYLNSAITGQSGISLDLGRAFKFMNPEYLEGETFKKIFGSDSPEDIKTYIVFLNQLVDNKRIEYINKINNVENQRVLSDVQSNTQKFDDFVDGKNMQELRNTLPRATRETSLLLIQYLLKTPIDLDYGYSVDQLRALTYQNIVFSSIKGANPRVDRKVQLEYNGGPVVQVMQKNNLIGELRLKDYNDQIILEQLTGLKTTEDYKVLPELKRKTERVNTRPAN